MKVYLSLFTYKQNNKKKHRKYMKVNIKKIG